ncbi:MAG: chromate transporter [Clostridiales bacterium]|jgi:chromate transporter|nr:chromate transporter [Clostridiales bacterium]
MNIFIDLFLSFLQVGALSIGGGYAAMPLIREQVVIAHPWLTTSDFADIVAISQMTPGPISLNAATFVGTLQAGIPGALVATVGCVVAPFIFSIILAKLYYKYRDLSLISGVLSGLRPAVVALIAAAGMDILVSAFWEDPSKNFDFSHVDKIAVVIFILAVFCLRKFKVDQIIVMLCSGVLGIAAYMLV